MTTVQRNSISNPAIGLLIYNLDIDCWDYFDGIAWFDVCGDQKEKPLMLPWKNAFPSGRIPLRNIYQDKEVLILWQGGNSTFIVQLPDKNVQTRDYSLDWSLTDQVTSAVVIDSSLYLLMIDGNTLPFVSRVYRYDLYNIGLGGTLVSFSGLPISPLAVPNWMVMTSDGTNVYFNYNAGNSTNDYIIAKYAITSPAVFTYQNSITCGSILDSFKRFFVDS